MVNSHIRNLLVLFRASPMLVILDFRSFSNLIRLCGRASPPEKLFFPLLYRTLQNPLIFRHVAKKFHRSMFLQGSSGSRKSPVKNDSGCVRYLFICGFRRSCLQEPVEVGYRRIRERSDALPYKLAPPAEAQRSRFLSTSAFSASAFQQQGKPFRSSFCISDTSGNTVFSRERPFV